MTEIRNALSLFDGISSGRHALEKANINFENYYSSEIDKKSVLVAQKNYPDTIQLGDVEEWESWDLEHIDLIMGGSPCQGFAAQGQQYNFDDPRSILFFTMIDIIKHFKPKYFLLENVRMRKEWEKIITEHMGVEPIHICSSLVSAQRRQRVYWANWPASQPIATHNHLSEILEKDDGMTNPAFIAGRKINRNTGKREDDNIKLPRIQTLEVNKDYSKMCCITTVEKDSVLTNRSSGRHLDAFTVLKKDIDWRYLTVNEMERLQTLPDDYTQVGNLSDSKRKSMLGNGWTIDVITHLLKQAVGTEPVITPPRQTSLFNFKTGS